jgi:hypothetical protein
MAAALNGGANCMESFEVESYKVRLMISRYGLPQSGIPTRFWLDRIIELTSQPQYHGIVERAFLSFFTGFDLQHGDENVVGRIDVTTDPYKPVIYGWLPSNEYSFWYELLRAERPLTFEYSTHSEDGEYLLYHVALRSSIEPIGEGPVDIGPYPEGFLEFRRRIISRPSNLPKPRRADK